MWQRSTSLLICPQRINCPQLAKGEAWQPYGAVLSAGSHSGLARVHLTDLIACSLGMKKRIIRAHTRQHPHKMWGWDSRAAGQHPRSGAGMTPAFVPLHWWLRSGCVPGEGATALHGCANIQNVGEMNMLTFGGQTCLNTSSLLTTIAGIFVMQAGIPLGFLTPSHENLYLQTAIQSKKYCVTGDILCSTAAFYLLVEDFCNGK